MERPLRWYVREWSELGDEAFAAAYGVPFLQLLARPVAEDGSESGSGRFVTMRIGKTDSSRPDPTELPVYPIRKVEGKNVFGMMITIGRASNNDIEIDAASISKFHAYVEQRADVWTIRDANSSNGTFVDEAQVPAEGSLPLTDKADVRFARAKCRFYLFPSFLELLRGEAERLRERGQL